MTDFTSWFNRVYPKLAGNGLWLRGGEINTLPASDFGRRPFRILIVRLSTWAHTVESFTHGLLYQLAREDPSIFPDIAYLPPAADLPFFAEDNVPWLLGTGTKRSPLDFDLIAISNSIVQELVNLPVLLAHSGIEADARKRLTDTTQPLVLLGGANAHNTGILWHEKSPVDGIFAGDNPDLVSRLFARCAEKKAGGLEKIRILHDLKTIPGFFLPSRPLSESRPFSANVPASAYPVSIPVPFDVDRLGRGSIPISEGCRFSCTFCSESHTRKPYREASVSAILQNAMAAKQEQGLERCELHSFNFNAHSQLTPMLERLGAAFDQVGLKSQRFDSLATNPGLLPLLHVVGKTNLTCGLEGISPKLRSYLNKELEESDLYKAFSVLIRGPIRELKVFLIATGLEEASDFQEFEKLLRLIRNEMRATTAGPRIVFSATPLVRFPWTPLAYGDSAGRAQMQKALAEMEKKAKSHGFEFRNAADLNEWELSQILCRTSHDRIYSALCEAAQESGFIYYRGVNPGFREQFRLALKKEGFEPDDLLRFGDRRAIWEKISPGLHAPTLQIRHRQAIRSEPISDCCRSKPKLCLKCVSCRGMKENGISPVLAGQLKQRLTKLKSEEHDVPFVLDITEGARGLPRKYIGLALARALMKAEPEWISSFRRYIGSQAEPRSPYCWVTGKDMFTLRFFGKTANALPGRFQNPLFREKVQEFMAPWAHAVEINGTAPDIYAYTFDAPFSWAGDEYLREIGMFFTVRKENENRFRYEIAAKSRKRDLIHDIILTRLVEGGCILHLVSGRKFEPEHFVKNCFALPQREDWVRIKMRLDWK